MHELVQLLGLTLIAGLAMPVGASFAAIENIGPRWLETEVRHSVIAFGGGALLSAVALVLVPEGVSNLAWYWVIACFAGGGVMFMALDIRLAANNTPFSQLTAMLSDFVPEALALGATFTASKEAGLLLAGIIALQNMPEGFNSYREIRLTREYSRQRIICAFLFMALLGPIAGAIGHFFLAESPQVVSGIMLFAAGGILYIVFQDIAPQAILKNHWAPPLGAVAGFLLGMLGHMAVGG
ncbi:ZIP family metal transporter [Marinobacter sp. CHS3-4]|uniref:ZIP family metal transporter n=1 Tax=Marinobacter sp. CHS3-4 TaxID=3045174 RepID=UPI0024B4FD0A|nr:ZIP family metal transporter [Marinobacter sp. CHS3-4]MDI9244251.1 ZIP family metal transporter [Marinobacter sp. CHS3-4]